MVGGYKEACKNGRLNCYLVYCKDSIRLLKSSVSMSLFRVKSNPSFYPRKCVVVILGESDREIE